MGDFEFGFDDRDGGEEVKNILYGTPESSTVNVLVAEYLDARQISFVAQFFKMQGADPLIVYPFRRRVTDRDFKKGVEKFFIDNVIEGLRHFMNPDNSVITMGRGLYAATRDVDLQVDAFYYNDAYQPSCFYCPFLRNYVYPVDPIPRIIKTDYHGNFVQLFDRYVTEFAKEQIKKAVNNHTGKYVASSLKWINVKEVKDANAQLMEWIAFDDPSMKYVALDIETGGFNRLSDPIGCITFSFDGETAYYLDWKGIDTDLLYQFLKTKFLITANGKFDLLFLQFHGVRELRIGWDTMIAGHFLNEMASASLKAHAWMFTDYGGYDIELEKYKRKFLGCRYIDIPKPIKMEYAGDDAAVTWKVWKKQKEVMSVYPDLLAYYERYAMGMLDVFKEMEFRGFSVDWDLVAKQGDFLKQKIAESEKIVFDAFGIKKTPDNANLLTSGKQLGLFLEERGWECINRVKKRIGGYYNVSKYEMNEWKKKGHKEAELILEYNKWVAIYDTFIGVEKPDEDEDEIYGEEDGLLVDVEEEIDPEDSTGLWKYRQVDGKIHTIYRPMMTHSHRNASTNPNLQNLSKRNWETAYLVRQCYQAPQEIETDDKETADFVKVYDAEHGLRLFKPGETFTVNWQKAKTSFYEVGDLPGLVAQYYKNIPKGEYHIFEADAAGLQARIAASMSGDPKLRELFLNNGDFHSTNAYNMMARYQKFEQITCQFEEGPWETHWKGQRFEKHNTFMEWEPVKITRGSKELDHAVAKEILKGDIIEPYGTVTGVSKSLRSLNDYEEFVKNCKYGRLKELRQIAKMCYAAGSELLVLDCGEYKYIKVEDFDPDAELSAFYNGIGVPYTGNLMAVDWDSVPHEILGTIRVEPEEKIEFELENGAVLTVTPDHETPVKRNGEKIIVPAAEVLETDELLEVQD